MKILDEIDTFTRKIHFGRIVILLLCLIFMKECCGLFYWRMSHLSEDDLQWWYAAQRYPTATFESDSGKKAYYQVWEKVKYNKTNPFYWKVSSAGSDNYEASALYEFIIKQDSDRMEGNFWIRRSIDNDSLMFSSRLNRFYSSSKSNRENDLLYLYEELNNEKIALGDSLFDDCLVMDSTNSWYNQYGLKTPNKITKYIISKKYGLIYYEFETGEKYYRKFE